MSETIPGGAYQAPDGTWHDAKGKPLSDRVRQQFEAQQAKKQQELQEAERNLLYRQQSIPSGLTPLQPPSPTVTTETGLQVEPADEAPATKRRSRKSE